MSELATTLPSISLSDMNRQAALQTRLDRKYVLTADQTADLVAWIGQEHPDTQVLEVEGERASLYDSMYYDTENLTCFRMALQQNRRRFKVRTRCYVDSGDSFLETKTKSSEGKTVKHRIPWSEEWSLEDDTPCEFLAESLADTPFAVNHDDLGQPVAGPELVPALRTVYFRTTLLLPNDHARITLDQKLRWQDPSGSWVEALGGVILETKTSGSPSAVDHFLWDRRQRPIPSSKYSIGISLTHNTLPTQRWTRAAKRLNAQVTRKGRHRDPVK
ncbi:MAG: polyphosphate polymerase domain-containing protein [Ancrocorticia populi]|uniref:polyphosphate polymerase domain-containing protein n=1 Tax=Ancrocorticia populi TaxID=2175228 RepID=UPI003F93570F